MSTTSSIQTTTNPARPLEGRVALVTGATAGIGAATARRLSADGAAVALLGRREDRLASLAAELTGADGAAPALALPTDATDPDALGAAVLAARAELGPIDLVVANAGQMLGAPFEQADVAEWDAMLDLNVRALLRTSRATMDDLLAAAAGGGAADLVLVGSVGGHQVFPSYAVYCATKAAVAHFSRNLRAEVGPRGVRVRNVEPGFVGTELGDGMGDDTTRRGLADMRTAVPPLRPEDIADAVAWSVAAPAHVNVAEVVVVPTVQG
jgi:NADP-dependent 3-hydroxy acid dehydrogenase YdfG